MALFMNTWTFLVCDASFCQARLDQSLVGLEGLRLKGFERFWIRAHITHLVLRVDR